MKAPKKSDHVWHCDLTTIPTAIGFWTSWFPFFLPQRWPYCWWVAVDIDRYSRRIMGFAIFGNMPSSRDVRSFLGRAIRNAGIAPNHLISDRGKQFAAEGFMKWCDRHGIRQRFGAGGKYESIAVIERVIKTMKSECTRRLLVPYERVAFRRELALYINWYNRHRPYEWLGGATPDEVYYRRRPDCRMPRYEPRRRWRRGSPCAGPLTKVRGRCGQRLEFEVTYLSGRIHLPIVELKPAA